MILAASLEFWILIAVGHGGYYENIKRGIKLRDAEMTGGGERREEETEEHIDRSQAHRSGASTVPGYTSDFNSLQTFQQLHFCCCFVIFNSGAFKLQLFGMN